MLRIERSVLVPTFPFSLLCTTTEFVKHPPHPAPLQAKGPFSAPCLGALKPWWHAAMVPSPTFTSSLPNRLPVPLLVHRVSQGEPGIEASWSLLTSSSQSFPCSFHTEPSGTPNVTGRLWSKRPVVTGAETPRLSVLAHLLHAGVSVHAALCCLFFRSEAANYLLPLVIW